MSYTVVKVDGSDVTLWDGVTKDPDHPSEKAGLATYTIPGHQFILGDTVAISLQLVARETTT